MPCAVATGSWGSQLAVVTNSDSSARRSHLLAAQQSAHLPPITADSDSDGCVLEAGRHFQKPVTDRYTCVQVPGGPFEKHPVRS